MTCEECKKDLETLNRCVNDEEEEWLCDHCLNKSIWYCHACGLFCAGITSFEFGPYPGLCDNCADQIKDSVHEEEDEDDFYFL